MSGPTSTLPSSPALLKQPQQTNGRLKPKFGTVSGRWTQARRYSNELAGLYDCPRGTGSDSSGAPPAGRPSAELRQLGLVEDKWIISAAEYKPSKENQAAKWQPQELVLTLYVATPHSSLTLTRRWSEILDLETRLRAQVGVHMPKRTLPIASHSPSSPPKKRVLASLTRGFAGRRDPQSFSSQSSAGSAHSVSIPDVGNYLTALAGDSLVRKSPVWRGFFGARKDDLESARTERRILRTRSDATTHLAPVGNLGGAGEDKGGQENVPVTTVELLSLPDVPASKLEVDLHLDGRRQGSAQSATSNGSAAAAPALDSASSAPSTPNEAGDGKKLDVPAGGSAPMARERTSSSTKTRAGAISIDDFEVMRVLGKGCAGKVLLVKERSTESIYAIKAIHKTHVLAHRELGHTRTEQAILRRMAHESANAFIVHLNYSFHDSQTLYLVLDFHPGGDLATQLARWGRLGRDRAKFYAAEIAAGLESLHRAGIIYRDLKPENLLISSQGHIVLTDFGLSRDFRQDDVYDKLGPQGELPPPRPHWLGPSSRSVSAPPEDAWAGPRELTTTFCGTAEYLAPEVLLGEAYSYECDSWSLGTMLFEMLAGRTPFYTDNTADMYRAVIHDRLSFRDCDPAVFDQDTQHLIRGLLCKNPLLRTLDSAIRSHAYFGMLNWDFVTSKRYMPPFIPELNPDDPTDLSQFDELYLSMQPQVAEVEGEEITAEPPEGEPQAAFDEDGLDVFDGYSYDPRLDGQTSDLDNDDDDERMDVTPTAPDVVGPAEEGDQTEADTSAVADNTFSSTATDSTNASTITNDATAKIEQPLSAAEGALEPVLEHVAATAASIVSMTVDDGPGKDEDEDDEWEHLEAEGVAKNGGKGTTLWARGVKDRYKLLVASGTSPDSSNGGGGSSSPRFMSRLGLNGNGSSRRSSLNVPSSAGTTPKSLTPEPPRSSGLIRLGSHRSDASGVEHHRSKKPTTRSDSTTDSSSGSGTLRKKGTIKRLTLGAFGKA